MPRLIMTIHNDDNSKKIDEIVEKAFEKYRPLISHSSALHDEKLTRNEIRILMPNALMLAKHYNYDHTKFYKELVDTLLHLSLVCGITYTINDNAVLNNPKTFSPMNTREITLCSHFLNQHSDMDIEKTIHDMYFKVVEPVEKQDPEYICEIQRCIQELLHNVNFSINDTRTLYSFAELALPIDQIIKDYIKNGITELDHHITDDDQAMIHPATIGFVLEPYMKKVMKLELKDIKLFLTMPLEV